MNKNRNLLKVTISALLIVSALGTVSVTATSDNYIKDKVNMLTEEFNSKKSNLEKTGTYDTTSEEAKQIKELGIQIADLSEQTKTEEEYSKKLESLIEGARIGLEDTKEEQKLNYDQSRQDFIDKMEKKLDDIEAEKKIIDEKKTENSSSSIDERPSKKLVERLRDRSDVEN